MDQLRDFSGRHVHREEGCVPEVLGRDKKGFPVGEKVMDPTDRSQFWVKTRVSPMGPILEENSEPIRFEAGPFHGQKGQVTVGAEDREVSQARFSVVRRRGARIRRKVR